MQVPTLFYTSGTQFSWLERRPVTSEVAGSNPVVPANFFLFLCKNLFFPRLPTTITVMAVTKRASLLGRVFRPEQDGWSAAQTSFASETIFLLASRRRH